MRSTLIFGRLRHTLLRDRFTIVEQVQRCFRAFGIALGASLLLTTILVYSALSPLPQVAVGLCAALDVVAMAVVAVLAGFTRKVLEEVALGPLTELSGTARRVGGGDLGAVTEPHGALELQQITATMGTLAGQLIQERHHRAADQTAGQHQATTRRQMLRFTQEVGGSLNLEQILRALASGAMTIGGYREAMIWLVDELERQLVPVYSSIVLDGRPAGLEPRPLNEGAIGRAATSAQTVTVRGDTGGEGLVVPLVRGLTVIGVVELSGEAGAKPSMADPLDAIETLASHAATAIAASRLHHEVELRSETDALTRVFNRRKLDVDLRVEVARSIRYGHSLALVMIDVDHFKAINDTFGHQQGDEVLKLVAAALVRDSRETDNAYRFGGEEFAVLLRETDLIAAEEVAERLRERIRSAVKSLGLPRDVTASLGVAAIAGPIQGADKLVEAADGALYRAKQTGRNRVCISSLMSGM